MNFKRHYKYWLGVGILLSLIQPQEAYNEIVHNTVLYKKDLITDASHRNAAPSPRVTQKFSRIVSVRAKENGEVRKIFLSKDSTVLEEKPIAIVTKRDGENLVVRSTATGRIVKMMVHVGDHVKKGARLFDILVSASSH